MKPAKIPKGYWKIPGEPVWCPTLRAWLSCTWARYVIHGGLRLTRFKRRVRPMMITTPSSHALHTGERLTLNGKSYIVARVIDRCTAELAEVRPLP